MGEDMSMKFRAGWSCQASCQVVIDRARKLWDDDHPFRGWASDERDAYIIRAAMEAAAARREPDSLPIGEIVPWSEERTDSHVLKSTVDFQDLPIGTKIYASFPLIVE